MPADTLFPAGAELLRAAGSQSDAISKDNQAKTDATIKTGDSASSELGAERRQMSSQQAAVALQKMTDQENKIQITPQLALGLVKNTGDKSWLQAVGTKMRADVYTGLYTHGMSLAQAKKAPKITQTFDKDSNTIRHAVVYTDEDGVIQTLPLDSGITPKKLNEGKGGNRGGGKGGGGNADSMDFKKRKEFLAQFNKRRAEYADPARAAEAKALDPEKYNQDMQWIKDKQDLYDKITTEMSQGGGTGNEAPAAAGGNSGAPFDADAFIKDALGSK